MSLEKPRFLMPVSPMGQEDLEVIEALAFRIKLNPKIRLSHIHVSRVIDQATARSNISNQMFGLGARRSNYENAPGGTVNLDVRLLRALLELSLYYSFSVSEIVGGSHSRKSIHYRGSAFDVNVINGMRVSAQHPDCPRFISDSKQLGATRVIGPPHPGHSTHVHVEWH